MINKYIIKELNFKCILSFNHDLNYIIKHNIIREKQICIFYLRLYHNVKLIDISNLFNIKNHSSIHHAIKTINNIRETDKIFNKKIIDFLYIDHTKLKTLLKFTQFLTNKNQKQIIQEFNNWNYDKTKN